MANPNIANEQLMELLLTLKKTTPAAARGILNSQPAIAYALISLMVSMNAISIEVFQKTLQEYGTSNGPDSSAAATAVGPSLIDTSAAQSLPPPAAPAPLSAIPPHIQTQYRTTTPPTAAASYATPTHTPTPPYGYPPNGQSQPAHPTPPGAYGSYGQQGYGQGYGYSQTPYQQQGHQQPYSQPSSGGAYPGYPSYGNPPHSQAPTPVAAQTPTPALPDTLAGIPDEQKALIMRVLSMTPEQINMLPPNERSTYIQIRATLGVPTPTG